MVLVKTQVSNEVRGAQILHLCERDWQDFPNGLTFRKGVKDDSKVFHLSNEKNGDANKYRWKSFWYGEDRAFCITHVESEVYIRHPSVDNLLLL